MRTVMVRYKTSEGHAAANESLVRAVFAELHANSPAGIRYSTYRLDDGVSFVHIASIDVPESKPLTSLASFQAFQKELKERCVEAPVFTDLAPVGSYSSSAS